MIEERKEESESVREFIRGESSEFISIITRVIPFLCFESLYIGNGFYRR